jgi:toxin ParE1/3/4
VKRSVVFSPEAENDIFEIYDFVSIQAGGERAVRYVNRIIEHCRKLEDFAERGTRRDDVWPGLRVIGFERRVAIAFHLVGESVIIDRVLYGGRDLSAKLFEKH